MPVDKEAGKAREEELVKLVTDFCNEKLNAGYAAACERMVRKLGRKRNKPLSRVDLEIWAATIVYTVGVTNFLFDRSNTPYLPADEIREYFGGVSQATITDKGKKIRDMIGMQRYWNPEYSTAETIAANPMASVMMDPSRFIMIHYPNK